MPHFSPELGSSTSCVWSQDGAKICVHPPRLSKHHWEGMCALIRQSTTLKCINICRKFDDARTAYDYLSMLFDANEQYECPLESIHFPPKDLLRRRHVQIVLRFLESRPTTHWSLNLESTNLGDGCIGLIIDAMNDGVLIKSLKLSGSGQSIDDDDFERLLTATNSQYLSELVVRESKVTAQGYDALASFLRRASTTIESLDVRNSAMYVECAQMLLGSIPTNSTLKLFRLGKLYNRPLPNDSYNATVQKLENLVCNQSSFNALLHSNHTLHSIGYNTSELKSQNANLRVALDINERKGCSINKKCRSKLRALYFRGEFDVHPFIGIDIELMPLVLELVTMSDECIVDKKEGRLKKGTYVRASNGHLGSIYRLIRNCHLPELFSFPSPESKMEQLEAKIASLEAQLASLTLPSNKRLKPSDT